MQKWGRETDPIDLMLYERWDAMMRRCFDPKCAEYTNYGGRGIRPSPEFCDGVAFVNYCKSLDGCPASPDYRVSIDRIDVNKGYERGNLRFATPVEQMRNLRTSTYVDYEGEKYHVRDWAEKFCKRYRPGVVVKLVKRGVPLEEILNRDQNSPHVGRRWGGRAGL